VRQVAESVFCPRAGVLALEGNDRDSDDDELRRTSTTFQTLTYR